MRVMVYPSDRTACGHYRILWPAQALRDQGHQITIRPEEPLDIAADVVVLQRTMSERLLRMVSQLRQLGTAVVVDIDDDFAAVDPRNPVWERMHPVSSPDTNWQWTQEICRQATLLTCSTPALAERYGSSGRTLVIPNYVPARFLQVPHPANAEPVLGWAGSAVTHPGDLRATGNAIARLGYPFHVVGPAEGVAAQLGVADGMVTGNGWVPFEDWPAKVAGLDVGVAPLADTRFNRAKSWLKPLEYSACGVAWVASDLPEYRRLHELGAGTVATKPAGWLRELRRLLTDDGYRAEQTERGRDVAGSLTVEGNAWRFWEAWGEAVTLERRPRTATAQTTRPASL